MRRACVVLALAALSVMALSGRAFAAGDDWMTDFEGAKTKAKQESKDLFVDFSGSDW